MVANESRLTNQRFCLFRLPFILIHSVTTVAKAHIQVTALASRIISHEPRLAICILYSHIVVQSNPMKVSHNGAKRAATAQG